MSNAHALPSSEHMGETVASQGVETYEEIWALIRTPTLSETNMPSALQTPRILTPRANEKRSPVLWPSAVQSDPTNRDLRQTEIENHPPSTLLSTSHPPVASRMRKRRRGASPVSGERALKSARRRGKAGAKMMEGQLKTDLHAGQENPWATPSAHPSSDAITQDGFTPTLLPQAFPSANQTPYNDFTRAGSATTSFYQRLNESGSYPTPHRMSVPSSPSNATLTLTETPRRPISHRSTSPRPSAPRRGSDAASQHQMEVDCDAGDARGQSEVQSSLLQRQMPRVDPFAAGAQYTASASQETRTRLREVLSDPSHVNDRTSNYRSPTVEDIPEEGELHGSRHPREAGGRRGRLPGESFRRSCSALPPMSSTPWQSRDPEDEWTSRPRLSTETPFSFHDDAASRFSVDWSSRTSETARRDVLPAFRAPAHQMPLHDVHQPRLDRDHQRAEHYPMEGQGRPMHRVNELDVFNVGDDDNLPEAVKRRGAGQEGDEETPTPIPHAGDPEVHRHDPEAHLQGLSDTWIQAVWADASDTSITLSTFNPRFTKSYGTNKRTASDLRRFISQITGETTFLVIAPDQALHHRGRGPVEWAITGLTRDSVKRLLRRHVWSFRSITFFPHRRALENPRWLLALEGFLEDNVANIEAAVRSTFERPQVRQRIEQMIRANPEFNTMSTEVAFRRIMMTLRVTVFTLDNETVVANVFLRSPTQSIRVWRRWIQELRELSFGSYHTAIARVRRISACAGCLGVDHPSHLCPFTQIPGWNGPEAAGGASYSVDGRERRTRQPNDTLQTASDSQPRRHRSQPLYGPDSSQAGPSRARNGVSDWEVPAHERGGERGRDYGRERDFDQGRRGPPRRGRRDGSGPARQGRDNYRKEGRR